MHPVKSNGLNQIVSSFTNQLITTKMLVFVTPHNSALHGLQKITKKKETTSGDNEDDEMQIQNVPLNVRPFVNGQYKCEYSISART